MSILQPVVCIQTGDSVLFDLGANKSSFPVYDKDSLLNTNPSFDYGAFRALAEAARSSSNVTSFGFTFRDGGVYVFYANGQPSLKSVISVRLVGERCPTDGTISPLTATVLVQLGVRRDTNIVVAPSWPVIIAILIGIVLSGVGALAAVYWLQHSKWELSASKAAPQYKQIAKAAQLTTWHSLGSSTSSTLHELAVKPAMELADVRPSADVSLWDKGDIDALALLERLEGHRDDVRARFTGCASQAEQLAAGVRQEFDDLRHMIAQLTHTAAVNNAASANKAAVEVRPRCLCRDAHNVLTQLKLRYTSLFCFTSTVSFDANSQQSLPFTFSYDVRTFAADERSRFDQWWAHTCRDTSSFTCIVVYNYDRNTWIIFSTCNYFVRLRRPCTLS